MTTKFIHQISYDVPTSKLADINNVFDALGFGPNNFSVPFSPSGNANATHYSCIIASTEEMKQTIDDAVEGTYPEGIDWAAYDLTEQKASAALNTLDAEPKQNGSIKRKTHMVAHGVKNGLKPVKPEEVEVLAKAK